MEGAEPGSDRSPKKAPSRGPRHNTEPETVAHEGPVSTRTPKRPTQGVTPHSAEEESARQQKVVNDRPDAQAGVKHSKYREPGNIVQHSRKLRANDLALRSE